MNKVIKEIIYSTIALLVVAIIIGYIGIFIKEVLLTTNI